MKPPKPGQYWSPDGVHVVRAVKRISGCKGCLYEDNILLCPGIKIKGQPRKIDCVLCGVIFIPRS